MFGFKSRAAIRARAAIIRSNTDYSFDEPVNTYAHTERIRNKLKQTASFALNEIPDEEIADYLEMYLFVRLERNRLRRLQERDVR